MTTSTNIALILSILSVLSFLIAAFTFHGALKRFTIGHFKQFNYLIYVNIVVILSLRIVAVLIQYFDVKGLEDYSNISTLIVLLLAITSALLFIFAGWKLRVMSEQFGFAKLDVGTTKMLKPAEKKFVQTLLKAKRR